MDKLKNKLAILFIILVAFSGNAQEDIERVFQTGHSGPIKQMVFSKDGKFLASIAENNEIIIWETEGGKQFAVLNGHHSAVNEIAFNPFEPNQLVSCSGDSTLIFWNYKSGSEISRIKTVQAIQTFRFGGSNEILIGGDHLLTLNTASGKPEILLENCHIKTMDVDNSGRILFGTSSGSVSVFDRSARSVIDSAEVNAVDVIFSAATNSFFVLEPLAVIREISLDDKNQISSSVYREQGKKYGFNTMAQSNERIYCAGGEQNIFSYDKTNFKSGFFYGHLGYINALAVNHSQTVIASAGADNTIVLWDLQTSKKILTLKGNYEQISALKFSGDKQALVIAGKSATLKYWELQSNEFHSMSVYLDESKKSRGWKNTIADIDSVNNGFVYITYVEYLPQRNTSAVSKAVFFTGVWDIVKNVISLEQKDQQNYRKANPANGGVIQSELFLTEKKKSNRAVFKTQLDAIILNHPDLKNFSDFDYNDRFGFFALAAEDGTIRFFSDKSSPEFLVQVGLFNTKDFLLTDDQNYYFGTKAAMGSMNIRFDENLYNIGILDVLYNRPDIILGKLPYFNSEELDFVVKAIENRRKKTNISGDVSASELLRKLPVIESNITFDSSTGKCIVKTTVTDQRNDAGFLLIKVNGVPVTEKEFMAGNTVLSDTIMLVDRTNFIEVSASGKNGIQSLPVSFTIDYDQAKKAEPTLYFVGIGVSKYEQSAFDLSYADKDIQDLMKLFERGKNFSAVRTRTFFNEHAIAADVLTGSADFLKDAQPGDVVVVFYAGHGVLDKNFDYYLGMHNMTFEQPELNGLSYDALLNVIDQSACRNKLFLIDACHSGEIDKDEVQSDVAGTNEADENITFRAVGKSVALVNYSKSAFELSRFLFNDLRPNDGTIVISSAGGLEFAMESEQLKNGIFTFALIEGITSETLDMNEDGRITVKELETYLPLRVQELTNGRQRANNRIENSRLNFVFY